MRITLWIALGILLVSCRQEGDINLRVMPSFDGSSLALNEEVKLGDLDVKFENLTLMLTDISLISKKGEEVKLADAEFVELNESGNALSFENIDGGVYERIRFNIGVPEDLNKKTPNDYNVDEPLGRNDHYWEAWGSYIFAKTEGSADPDKDGIYDLKWFYHTGSDALLRTMEMEIDLTIDDGAASSLELALDYKRLLQNDDGSFFDIVSKPRNHNPDDTEIITKLVDNYEAAFNVMK